MCEEWRKKLDQHRLRLVEELEVNTTFLASLLSKKVINGDNKSNIEAKKTSPKQADVLIEILKRKSNEHFKTFCQILKDENNSDLHGLLTGGSGENAANESPESPDERLSTAPKKCEISECRTITGDTASSGMAGAKDVGFLQDNSLRNSVGATEINSGHPGGENAANESPESLDERLSTATKKCEISECRTITGDTASSGMAGAKDTVCLQDNSLRNSVGATEINSGHPGGIITKRRFVGLLLSVGTLVLAIITRTNMSSTRGAVLIDEISVPNCNISGIARIQDKLILTCDEKVAVLLYSVRDRTFNRLLDSKEPTCFMVGFNEIEVLYLLSGCGNKRVEYIWMINMTDGVSSKKEVDGHPFSLSVSGPNELLVIVLKCSQWYLYVYRASDFVRLKVILLSLNSTLVWHAVKKSAGTFIVSYAYDDDCTETRIVEISPDGHIIKTPQFSIDLKLAMHLAITENDEIFIADKSDERIYLIDSNLQNLIVMVSNDRFNIPEPHLVHYEADRKLLFVGHESNKLRNGLLSQFTFQ